MISRIHLIIIFILLAVFIGFFLINPKYQEMLAIRSEIGGVEISIEQGEAYYLNLRKTSEKLEQYQDQLSLIDSAFPEKVYLPHLYNFLKETCAENGLVFQGISSSFGSSKESRIQEISINLSVIGTYSFFKDFLSSLESSVRFFSVETISFSGGTEEPFNFNLNIKTQSY